jgi:hypothetical protein
MKNTVFFVISEEEFALCPICCELLVYHSRVRRLLKDASGKETTYNVRVLKCENEACPQTYHRELPDIIIPYRRYDTETIETAIDNCDSDLLEAPDMLTIKRWQEWFKSQAIYIMMALLSIAATIENNVETSSLSIQEKNSDNPLETIKKIVARKIKWLGKTARILVNSSKWLFNRSECLSEWSRCTI